MEYQVLLGTTAKLMCGHEIVRILQTIVLSLPLLEDDLKQLEKRIDRLDQPFDTQTHLLLLERLWDCVHGREWKTFDEFVLHLYAKHTASERHFNIHTARGSTADMDVVADQSVFFSWELSQNPRMASCSSSVSPS